MTLLDAPVLTKPATAATRIDPIGAVRALSVSLVIGIWLVAGLPVDWPWNWWTHLRGRIDHQPLPRRRRAERPGRSLRHLDPRPELAAASRTRHRLSLRPLPGGLEPDQRQNEYGAIKSHQIVAGAHVRQRAAGGHPHQRAQEQGALPRPTTPRRRHWASRRSSCTWGRRGSDRLSGIGYVNAEHSAATSLLQLRQRLLQARRVLHVQRLLRRDRSASSARSAPCPAPLR